MKIYKFILAGVLILSGAGAWADAPLLEPGVTIKDGGVDLIVGKYASPTSADWDNDGARDLIIGQNLNGHVWLYLNQGTDLNPLFNGGVKIESNNAPISFPSS